MTMPLTFVDQTLRAVGHLDTALVEGFTERHHFRAPTVRMSRVEDVDKAVLSSGADGVLFALNTGIPSRRVMSLAGRALRRGRVVYFYWPAESAVELVTRERLSSFKRHWFAFQLGRRLLRAREKVRARRVASKATDAATPVPTNAQLARYRELVEFIAADVSVTTAHVLGGHVEVNEIATQLESLDGTLQAIVAAAEVGRSASHLDALKAAALLASAVHARTKNLVVHTNGGGVALQRIETNTLGLLAELKGAVADNPSTGGSAAAAAHEDSATENYRERLRSFAADIGVLPFPPRSDLPRPDSKIPGTGVYVRTSYWAHLVSGGSYGHTCYVADELAKVTDNFVGLMGSPFQLLADLGIKQEIVKPPFTSCSERDLLAADQFYYEALKERLTALRPSYIYERLVMGNFACARLSRELGIPYIVEYNGSEISMSRSFGSGRIEFEDLFIEAERVAFEQATLITAISDHVRDDVVSRGIDPGKVLVNPNGVNCTEYSPAGAQEKTAIRAELGFADDQRVIGFIGTFGGWHGIDVLAESLAPICEAAPNARFLLIGDGNLKHLVTEAISKHGLDDRVVDLGRTEQRQGARFLKAADIYVSPHSSHMVDSKFFGSPTKLFEYMALGGGIVASALEQIFTILNPALTLADFAGRVPQVDCQRALVCRPGNRDEFVAGVLALVRNPEVSDALGRNARAAAAEHFSWERHIARIWDFAHRLGGEKPWRP